MTDPNTLQTRCTRGPEQMCVLVGLIEVLDVVAGLLLQAAAQQSLKHSLRFGSETETEWEKKIGDLVSRATHDLDTVV